jgi:hypothetical protein
VHTLPCPGGSLIFIGTGASPEFSKSLENLLIFKGIYNLKRKMLQFDLLHLLFCRSRNNVSDILFKIGKAYSVYHDGDGIIKMKIVGFGSLSWVFSIGLYPSGVKWERFIKKKSLGWGSLYFAGFFSIRHLLSPISFNKKGKWVTVFFIYNTPVSIPTNDSITGTLENSGAETGSSTVFL